MKTDDCQNSDLTDLGRLIIGMRNAYYNGENAMEYARRFIGQQINSSDASLIAYDLQAGSYIADTKKKPEQHAKWCWQLSEILKPYMRNNTSILEVGCGEATTLSGVLHNLNEFNLNAKGFDISWSRCAYGKNWLENTGINAELFVADLFNIPLDDSCIDVVYTSHSIEPNGGREHDAIQELLRITRRAVILVEPIYELANSAAQERMLKHGYIRNLKQTAEKLGANISDYRLLDYSGNPLNPSGLIIINKSESVAHTDTEKIHWRCPLTHTPLRLTQDVFYSQDAGIVYPILSGIPLLRDCHGVVASGFEILKSK